jgi:predicted Zn-dependent peptidase
MRTLHRRIRPGAAAPVATLAALLLLTPAARAKGTTRPALAKAAAGRVRTGLENLEAGVRQFTLANGLTFIVVERHQAPVFSFETVVNAGSANDHLGTTGLAHMMEHMAFKGTAVVGTKDYAAEKPLLDREEAAWGALLGERRKGAAADTTRLARLAKEFGAAQEAAHAYVVSNGFQKVLESAGAQNWNAFTANDVTAYLYSLPSNRLELWALMEGGRMAHPVFREFYKERDVVYEERRMSVESSPLGRLFDEFIHAAFVAHPYGFGGIGFPSDLHTFSRTQGEEYFRSHYVAPNMTVCVVGDVTVDAVRKVAEQYFSDVPAGPMPPPIDTVEPEQTAERRVILEEQSQPIVLIGWHIPAATDPSTPAYRALADLLAGGNYSRLYKRLVKEAKVAVRVQGFTGEPGEKYPNLLGLLVVPATGRDPEKVERAVYDVLDEIRTKAPFTADELAGYKVRRRAERVEAVEENANLAEALAMDQTLYGNWHEFFREQERVQSLTPADVLDAMTRALVRSNRTVGLIENPAKPAAQGGHGE